MDGEIVVRRYDAPHEAELAASYLREHGLSARVDNDLLVGMNPLWGTALGGVHLLVPEEDATLATELLDRLDVAPSEDRRARSPTPDDAARRALIAATLGSIALPGLANLYSLAVALPLAQEALSPRGRRHRWIALGIDILVLGLGAFWLTRWLSPVEG